MFGKPNLNLCTFVLKRIGMIFIRSLKFLTLVVSKHYFDALTGSVGEPVSSVL